MALLRWGLRALGIFTLAGCDGAGRTYSEPDSATFFAQPQSQESDGGAGSTVTAAVHSGHPGAASIGPIKVDVDILTHRDASAGVTPDAATQGSDDTSTLSSTLVTTADGESEPDDEESSSDNAGTSTAIDTGPDITEDVEPTTSDDGASTSVDATHDTTDPATVTQDVPDASVHASTLPETTTDTADAGTTSGEPITDDDTSSSDSEGSDSEGSDTSSSASESSDSMSGTSTDDSSSSEDTTTPEPFVLGAVPPMGWNSFNAFGEEITEERLRAIADVLVDSGLRDAGYNYLIVDEGWASETRDPVSQRMMVDQSRFPSGMKAFADYVHERGLKLGLFSSRGLQSCGRRMGSYGYEVMDAETFADWGVDYLKHANCWLPEGREGSAEMEEDYRKMGDALQATGRDIFFNLCTSIFYDWMPDVGHSARTTIDISDSFSGSRGSITALLNANGGDSTRYPEVTDDATTYPAPGLSQYAGPGYFNDPDALEVGNGGMTAVEYRAQFSLWAIMAAPLIASNDVRTMNSTTVEILTNAEVIAVDQDPLGIQGHPVSPSTTLEVWVKPLRQAGTFAVVLFNRTEDAADITVAWEDLDPSIESASVRDLWQHSNLGTYDASFTASVESHGVVMLRVTGD